MLKKHDYVQITTYLFLGAITFLTELSIFVVLVKYIPEPIYIANSISFLSGMIISYLINSRTVFRRSDSRHGLGARVSFYLILALFNILMSNLLLGIFITADTAPTFAKIITMILIAGWNYVIYKKLIFASK